MSTLQSTSAREKNSNFPASYSISDTGTLANSLATVVFILLIIPGIFLTYRMMPSTPLQGIAFGLCWFFVTSLISSSIRLAAEWERGVVFRLGKFSSIKGPGVFMVIPVFDQVQIVDVRVRAMDIPSQQVITKDNVPVTINGVIFFKVKNASDAIIKVQNYHYAISQYAQTSLRDVIGQITLDQLLTEREQIGKSIEGNVEKDTMGWGLEVTGIRIQDIEMPEDLKKMMSRQASAEREKRATITKAEGDRDAASNLAQAARTMIESPGAMQLRTLQTIDGLGPTASNTVVIAIPMDVMELAQTLNKAIKSKS